MGLLDEAIREHLDLKRRRGADPAEVERAEREALGPVRRNREPEEEGEVAAAGAVDAPAEDQDYGAVDQGFAYDHEAEEQEWEGEPEGAVDDSHELRDRHPDDRGQRHDDEPASEPDPFAGEPFPTAPPVRRRPSDPPDNETAEYDVEGAHSGDEGDDDVLEETPEFLQDTPDHDRLWFEQRPPRDFDFDG